MCDENLLKFWKLVGFQKNFDPKCVGNFLKKSFFFFFVENFELVNYFKKTCWAFIFLFENSVGFSSKDLGKFSKNLSFFEKILNLKLVENLVEFSLENFDILIKICICENMLGILGMILSCLLEI